MVAWGTSDSGRAQVMRGDTDSPRAHLGNGRPARPRPAAPDPRPAAQPVICAAVCLGFLPGSPGAFGRVKSVHAEFQTPWTHARDVDNGVVWKEDATVLIVVIFSHKIIFFLKEIS